MKKSQERPQDPKQRALQEQATLNPHPEEVTDPLFQKSEFFDPRDLLQVKYEMLRRVETEEKTVSDSARSFGFSRPTFYQAQAAFGQKGLSGLVPQKRGPRGGHKFTDEVLKFLRDSIEKDGPASSRALVGKVRERFGLKVHQRTIERALAR